MESEAFLNFNQGFTKAHLPLVVPEHQRSVSLQLNGLNFYQGFTKAHMPLVVPEHHRSVSLQLFAPIVVCFAHP